MSVYLETYPIRISTMTQVSSLTTQVDLQKVFAHIPVGPDEPITYAIHGYDEKGVSGKNKRKVLGDETVKGKKRKRYFFNQVTLHIQLDKTINMKVFNNGGIQMTGLKSTDQGERAINTFISRVQSLDPSLQEEIFIDTVQPACKSSRMVMINSDFDLGIQIDREILHRLIIESGHYSSYNRNIYPGVNIKYYYNPDRQSTGICNCHSNGGACDGKGKADACKKITVAVFMSGKIIITGGQEMAQIHTAHEFICRFILDRQECIAMK